MNPASRCFLMFSAMALVLLGSCGTSAPVTHGEIDVTHRDWNQGPVMLAGEWGFESGFRTVPDAWIGSVAGGHDGRGSGTYHLKILADADQQLALRYESESTAFSVSANGTELIRIGRPNSDLSKAVSGYAPGTVRLPQAPELDIDIFVSNPEYRVGGMWTAPLVGPAVMLEHQQWIDEVSQIALGTGLAVISLSSLLIFAFRRSETTFAYLGLFGLVIAVRCLVTGEYSMVKILPGIPFHFLIRLEYWTAFLPLPAAAGFFLKFYPGLVGKWGRRYLIYPSLLFAILPFFLPLDLLTRAIVWYYPLSIPALVYGAIVLVRRILKERRNLFLLVGVAILIGTGIIDTMMAALFAATGTWIPWGLGLFVALQAASLARAFLSAFEATEAHLTEKEFLIREIHHRVKNSLQVVASLVTLQARRIDDAAQREVFLALRRRVTAIALVQEKLYSRDKGLADLGEYLKELLHLQYADDLIAAGLAWKLEGPPLAADADYCVDVGLILTELVANAHKHAVMPKGGGTVSVTVSIGTERLTLQVDDEGPGFPAGFEPGDEGLGLQVVTALLGRHNGSIEFLTGTGGRVRVDLKLPSASD